MRSLKRFGTLAMALCMLLMPALSACRNTPQDPATDDPSPSGPSEPVGPSEPEQPAVAPSIEGVRDVSVRAGRTFDVFEGITATAADGTDLTDKLSVSGEVDFSRPGEYVLTYSVTDGGKTATAQRKVSVTENMLLGQEEPVYLYTSETAYNIARGTSVTAERTRAGSNASAAADGDLSTRWESDWGIDGISLTVDLGASVSVEGVAVCWEAAYATQFEVQLSEDGKQFSTKSTVTAGENWTPQGVAPVYSADLAGTARYVRILMKERAMTAYGYSIYEVQVFGKQGTVIPYEEYPILFDAQREGSEDWAIADEQTLTVDMGAAKTFDSVELSWNNWLSPVSYDLEFSADGSAWTPFTLNNGAVFTGGAAQAVTARYVRVNMHSRRFYSTAYRINYLAFRLQGETLDPAAFTVTASSEQAGYPASNAVKNDNYSTCWASAHEAGPQTVDLGAVKDVGRIDLYWRGDDGRKGKYYDLQVSDDGTSWTTVFRQTHGNTELQSVYYFGKARYLRVLDYQNAGAEGANAERYMLEGIVVHSQYPNEGKVDYDTTLAFPSLEVVETQNGSYVTDDITFPTAKLIANLDDSLRGKPVPSNDWWQSLLINDKGHSMYLNPLTATFTESGLWLTNPGAGYFSGTNPGNGRQTIDTNAHDLAIGYAGVSASSKVRVTGYSDYAVTAVMYEKEGVDDMTVYLSQGALYAYCLFAEPQKAQLTMQNFVAAYAPDGTPVLADGTPYTGDALIVCVRTHSGYEDGKETSGNATYEERFYVVSVPAGTVFTRKGGTVSVNMTQGNYLSVGAMSTVNTVSAAEAQEDGAHGAPDLAEAALLHEHGYAFVVDTVCPYNFDEAASVVQTSYLVRTFCVREGASAEAYTAFLPHQYKKSADDLAEGYVYSTVRGDMRAHVGNEYTTEDVFYGIVPQFVEPTAEGYSASVLYAHLNTLYTNMGGGKSPAECNLISGDPYWQGKNLHPMALAALAADQLGATDLRDGFLDKIAFVLEDWFTYTPGNEPNDAYFYYDDEWGTLYYKNSEFGANVNLADHHFTYGYFTLAAGVLCAYRPDFAEKHGDFIELLIRDYMNPSHEDELFPYMRNYDVFAGHSWAGGYADNDGGNNQESAGEALNSWVGAYLYAMAVGNDEIRDAAIYGFTTELAAIKQYWFNYGGDSFSEDYPYGAIGQLYGASNFFGTFFNGEPLYVYGIHMVPGGEYLSGYALTEEERASLESVLESMKKEQANWGLDEANSAIHAWQHVFIPMTAMYDADAAIAWYESLPSVGNDNEQFNVYHIMYAMKSLGHRTTEIWATGGMSATVYEKDGVYRAICWNPTAAPVTIVFRNEAGEVGSAVIPACTLTSVDPTEHTQRAEQTHAVGKVTPADYAEADGVTVQGGSAVFADGAARYRLAFGTKQDYARIVLDGTLEGAQLFIDGTSVALEKRAQGYVSEPVSLTFKHTVEVKAQSGTLTAIGYEYIALRALSLQGAAASASTENGANVAENVLDGDLTATRWESVHGEGVQWLEIVLPEAADVYQMQIVWEAASAAQYRVYFSVSDDGPWEQVYDGTSTQGARTDIFSPDKIMSVKRIRIECVERTTQYGYSIYEIALFGI